MDPVTIIGTAASITSTVEVICKAMKSLRELYERWQDVDLTILSLISQLNVLKAALNKIGDWISDDLTTLPQHHQLVIDLEDSTACVRMLIKSIDIQLSSPELSTGNSLVFSSKMTMMLEDISDSKFQTLIDRQISALTLLLTACNWYVSPLALPHSEKG